MRGWTAYFFAGFFALIMGWAFTGCRFGNDTVPPPPPPENPDQTTGYYRLNPQFVNLCATTGATNCKTMGVNMIPGDVAQALSNPVALIMQDLSTGEAALVDSRGSGGYLPIYVQSDNSVSMSGYYPSETLFLDTACTSTLYLVESGDIQKYDPKSVDSDGRTISGEMHLRVQLVTTFDGSCDATLSLMKACYLNEADCGGATATANTQLHQTVLSVFGDYLDNAVMTADDIPLVSALTRDITYR